MSAWLGMLNTQRSAPTARTPPTRARKQSNSQRSSTAVHRPGGGNAGILSAIAVRLNPFETSDYAALEQHDVELGAECSSAGNVNSNQRVSRSESSNDWCSNISSSSSSEEDLYLSHVRRPRRKVNRKMLRKGTYSMRDGLDISRQYYPAATQHHPHHHHYHYHHHHHHQEQQQQQQQQQLYYYRYKSQQQQQQQPKEQHKCFLHIPLHQQQQQLQYQQQQQQQHQQHQQQLQQQLHQQQQQLLQQQLLYQKQQSSSGSSNNIWLTYNNGAELDDYYWKNPNKQCPASGDLTMGVGKTYITPGDIPPPPPHPAASMAGSKRFHSTAGRQHHPHQHTHPHGQQQHLHPPQQQQQRSRCQCDHPIEIVETAVPPPPAPPPPAATQPPSQRSYHHQHEHLTPREHVLLHPQYHKSPHPHPHHHHHHQQQQQLAPATSPSQQHPRHQHQHHQHHQHHQFQTHRGYTDQPQSHHNKSTVGSRISMKNLVNSQMKVRRLRIILGVLFGLVVIALLATALTFIIKGNDFDNDVSDKRDHSIHLEDVLAGQLAARHFNGSWSAGSNVIYRDEHSIVEYDVKTKRKTELIHDKQQIYFSYEKSADGLLLLLAKNYKKIFRHSYLAEYDIYNISTREIRPLNITGSQKFITMAQWAPVGNGLIINYDRNLYYKTSAFAEEITITHDDNTAVLNGIPDWVYEEEVFSSNTATWFNPAGTMIAFIRFDDSPTHVINFPFYGEAGDLRYQYPINRLVAYPKAGSSNPRVTLWTSDLVSAVNGVNHLSEIPVPSALNTETDFIISVVEWLDNENVLSVWMNRIQKLAYLQVFNGLRRFEIYNMESKSGWVDLYTSPFKNRDGSRIALLLPTQQDDEDYYRHVCTLSTAAANSNPEVLTKGKYVVQSIMHWDTTNDIIFYTANTAQKSEILHLYAVRAVPGQTPTCLTCNLQQEGGIEQTYFSAVFNTDKQVVINSLGPGVPQSSIYEWSYATPQVTLTKLITWESNEHLRTKLKDRALPTTEIHTISIAGGFSAKVLLQLPPNIDRSGRTKYPMLVDVYGGPDSNSVVTKWSMDWGTYLSSNQSVIYAKIDGRGSGLRGDKLLHSVYLRFGTVEITDQIDVAHSLQKMFSFIDRNHTGIWGWSYGGYAAAMALATDDTEVYRCAASIAPVTDWAYYDSIYTERYMSLPKLNDIGYANARLSTRAQRFRGKKFLLVHGTLDDNVHYQQAMILAKNLERNDILFKQISYPDEDHGLAGVRPHLYHSLDRFFGECFARKSMMGTK